MDQASTIGLAVGVAIGGLVLLVLVADCVHVFWFVRYYHRPMADPGKVKRYRERMEAAYHEDAEPGSEPNPFAHIVTDAEFEASLREFEADMDRKGAHAQGSIFGSFEDAYMRLLREAIGVVIAPRAVLFQVAHPFVAVGIKNHSNVIRDTPRRFERTYHHMFTLAFGSRENALKSARTLRRIHKRVTGVFPHDVGTKIARNAPYSAQHTHALLWVGLSLGESVLLGYQAMVGTFSEQDKAELARDAAHAMTLFGIPKSVATGTYDDFRVAIEACWESDIIVVSEEATFIAQHLLYPKKWYLKPAFAFARWFTRAIMPPKLATQFFGRESYLVEQLIVAALGGITRFTYRVIPGPLRYVPEYSQAVRRAGKRVWIWPFDLLAYGMERSMAWTKDTFIAIVMPSPKEAGGRADNATVQVADGTPNPTFKPTAAAAAAAPVGQ